MGGIAVHITVIGDFKNLIYAKNLILTLVEQFLTEYVINKKHSPETVDFEIWLEKDRSTAFIYL